MWHHYLMLSVGSIILSLIAVKFYNIVKSKKRKKLNMLTALIVGTFFASAFMFMPIHNYVTEGGLLRSALLSVFNTMQLFTLGAEFQLLLDSIADCPEELTVVYEVWGAILYAFAPLLTFGFVLTMFKNINAYIKYLRPWRLFRDVYAFSELNDKSLALAADIKKKNKGAVIIFTDVYEDEDEENRERIDKAQVLDAICFQKDMTEVAFGLHMPSATISFFTISDDEGQNLDCAISLIERYKKRKKTNVYAFSTKTDGELVLTALDKGEVRVRRINEVQSLINRTLYKGYDVIFDRAKESDDGVKEIGAVVIGMGGYGTEMVKALAWYGQMDGYHITIDAFDRDVNAESKFISLAPELMSPDYNGVLVKGEAEYTINIHSGFDIDCIEFDREIAKLRGATYVFVSLGDDDVNIRAAAKLRMLFERMKLEDAPVIQSVLHNSKQKKALEGIKNHRDQYYNIDFIGDLESSYSEEVIIDSELEDDALERHMKYGSEDSFWTYEYNYRSSIASAIHLQARIDCGIAGAGKKEEDLTDEEKLGIEELEHKRWNAYMRSEGFVYSGSKDSSSRNDLGKMHHNLVDYASLPEEDKRKDSRVGSR